MKRSRSSSMNRATSTVSVYSWGRGDFGQLGLGDENDRDHPALLQSLVDKDILHIAAGDFHTAFLTGDGEIYTTGSNECGQLGAKMRELQLSPIRVAALDTYTISHVACGQNHTVAVTDTGALASWGAAEFGQVGNKEAAGSVDYVQPRIVKGTRELQFVRVACGAAHTVALTGSGDVYTFGQGGFGALGHGSKDDITTPQLVEILWGLGIVQVACGENHSAALSADGQVFTWGRGKYGQLGHGTVESELHPVAVTALSDQMVVQVVCGGDHTMAVNSEGELVAWGRNLWGQTGTGAQEDTLLPYQILSLKGERIVQASAGARHSIALTDSGKVFGWGDGEQGQLGQITSSVLRLPTLLAGPENFGKLLYVVAGGEHTLAVYEHLLPQCQRSVDTSGENYTNTLSLEELQLNGASRELSDYGCEQRVSPADEEHGLYMQKHDLDIDRSEGMNLHGEGLRRLKLLPIMRVLEGLKGSGTPPREILHMTQALEHTFASVKFLILAFKRLHEEDVQTEGPGLDTGLIRDAYQGILELYNAEIVKKIGSAIVKLLDNTEKHMDHMPESRWLRVIPIVLQSPLIGEKGVGELVSSRLFYLVSRLSPSAVKKLIEWLRSYPKDIFGGRFVRGVQKYITSKLQVWGGKGKIPGQVLSPLKALSILHEANKLNNLVHYSDFYSYAISESINFQEQYVRWLEYDFSIDPKKPVISYCQVPYVLTPDAKSKILQAETNIQKQHTVQRSVFNHIFGNTFTLPFLILMVRRSALIADTLQQLSSYSYSDLKKPLKVVFDGEAGIDEGGVTKEFFQLLVRDLFGVSYGMFTYNDETRTIWFNQSSIESADEFRLVGIVLGLAIHNGVILDIHFPLTVYKKVMDLEMQLEDLKDVQPHVFRGLQQLLEFEGDIESTFCLTFQIEYDYFGEIKTHELIPGGSGVPITKDNRKRYVDLYVSYVLEESIEQQFSSFKDGFHQVCTGPALKLFRYEELELLICGLPHFDFDALERVTVYQGGYTKNSKIIIWFWEVVRAMPLEDKKQLLFFSTGNDRAPIGGLACLKFIVQKNGDETNRLPTAQTCFNILLLPEYSTKSKLENRLKLAIQNSTGFGLQ